MNAEYVQKFDLNKYHDLYTVDNENVDYLIEFKDISTVVNVVKKNIIFELDLILSHCFPFNDQYLGFYDYQNDLVGVISLEEQSIKWKRNMKISPVKSIIGDKELGRLIIQSKNKLNKFLIDDPENIEAQISEGRIEGSGEGWIVISNKNTITVNDIYTFKIENSLSFVKETNGYLQACEDQGIFRVFEINENEIFWQYSTPKGARISQSFVDSVGNITLGISFFGKNQSTEVRKFDKKGNEIDSCIIPCAGKYIIINEGNEFVFATGSSYMLRTTFKPSQ